MCVASHARRLGVSFQIVRACCALIFIHPLLLHYQKQITTIPWCKAEIIAAVNREQQRLAATGPTTTGSRVLLKRRSATASVKSTDDESAAWGDTGSGKMDPVGSLLGRRAGVWGGGGQGMVGEAAARRAGSVVYRMIEEGKVRRGMRGVVWLFFVLSIFSIRHSSFRLRPSSRSGDAPSSCLSS